MNKYFDYNVFYNKLKSQYKKHKRLIILYDFDDTVYSLNGIIDEEIVSLLRRWKPYACLICYTVRTGKEVKFAKNILDREKIPYNYINRDMNGKVPKHGAKIYGNILLDDKCGMDMAYKALSQLIDEIEKGEV